LGLSQTELAERIGPSWTPKDVKMLESARVVWPSWIRLLELAEALELPIAVLTNAACQTRVEDGGHDQRRSARPKSLVYTRIK